MVVLFRRGNRGALLLLDSVVGEKLLLKLVPLPVEKALVLFPEGKGGLLEAEGLLDDMPVPVWPATAPTKARRATKAAILSVTTTTD